MVKIIMSDSKSGPDSNYQKNCHKFIAIFTMYQKLWQFFDDLSLSHILYNHRHENYSNNNFLRFNKDEQILTHV